MRKLYSTSEMPNVCLIRKLVVAQLTISSTTRGQYWWEKANSTRDAITQCPIPDLFPAIESAILLFYRNQCYIIIYKTLSFNLVCYK